jgi:hypothetical protein
MEELLSLSFSRKTHRSSEEKNERSANLMVVGGVVKSMKAPGEEHYGRPKGVVKNLRNRSSFFEAEGWYSKEELTVISAGA